MLKVLTAAEIELKRVNFDGQKHKVEEMKRLTKKLSSQLEGITKDASEFLELNN